MLPPCHLLIHLIQFWAFPWLNRPQLSLTLNYLSIILKLKFPLQTPMATNSKPVLQDCNCYQYFPSLAAFLHEVSFPPAVLSSHLRQVKKDSLHLAISPCLCHTDIFWALCPVSRGHPSSAAYLGWELQHEAAPMLNRSARHTYWPIPREKLTVNLVFILPFAHLVIFNLDVKTKAAFVHPLSKPRSAFSSEGNNL